MERYGKDKAKIEFMQQVANGVEDSDAEGPDVFQTLGNDVLKGTDWHARVSDTIIFKKNI